MCSDLFKLKVPKVIKWYVFCQQCRRILFFLDGGGGSRAKAASLCLHCQSNIINHV